MAKRRKPRPVVDSLDPVGRVGKDAAGAGGAVVDDARWGALAAEVFVGIKEWRQQHPTATFTEIEQALDARWAVARARLLGDLAQASATTRLAAWPQGHQQGQGQGQGQGHRPVCPSCGGRLERRGTARRQVGVTHNQEVALERAYAVCTTCGSGLFPPG